MAANTEPKIEAPLKDAPPPKFSKRKSAAAPPPGEAPPKDAKPKEDPKNDASRVAPETLRRGGEIVGLLLACLSVALLMAITSFRGEDLAQDAGPHHNLIGPLGTYAAEILLYTFGIGAFFFVGILFLLGGFMLVGRRPDLKPSEFVGYGLLVLGGGVLFHFLFLGETVLDHQAGGLLGKLVGEALQALIGLVGAYLLGACLCVLSITLITDRSLGQIVMWVGGGLSKVFDGVSFKVEAQREFQRRLKEIEEAEHPKKPSLGRQEALEAEVAARLEQHKERQARRRLEQAFGEDDEKSLLLPKGKPALEKPAEKKALSAPKKLQKLQALLPSRAAVQGELDLDPDLGALDLDDLAEPSLDELGPLPTLDGQILDDEDDESVSAPPRRPEPTASPKRGALSAHHDGSPSLGSDGPQIVETEAQRMARERQRRLEKGVGLDAPRKPHGSFALPSLDFLDYKAPERNEIDEERLRHMAAQLAEKLASFGVQGEIVEIRQGPVITMFEFAPAPGVKLSRIAGLADDLAMALAAHSVRIIAPIPGKGVVGIEVPNDIRETVYLKEILADEIFQDSKARMPMALGKDTEGSPVVTDLAAMPHLLVAGSTGSGKSVAVNTMIVSLLFRFTPEEVRFIMVDPKMLEFSTYEGIPHLLLPVVTDPQKAASALTWAVGEMERRYHLLAEMGVRNITSYNKRVKILAKQCEADQLSGLAKSEAIDKMKPDGQGNVRHPPLPCIVCIIDEFADLMMVASKDVETGVARLAQKARAAGIHLILATQRPSVDVITGLIKANFPTRIALRVAQKIDSRTILDANGAESLLGRGDMLFLPPGSSQQTRVHGALVTEEEIEKIVTFLKAQGSPEYDESILATQQAKAAESEEEDELSDELYDAAIRFVAGERFASISMLQRKMRIGYNRSARIIERMERDGIIGPSEGSSRREVLVSAPP